MSFLESLTAELNSRYQRWSFEGDIVEWYKSGGQKVISTVQVIADTQSSAKWKHRGKLIIVRPGEPSNLVLSSELPQKRAGKSTVTTTSNICPYRGEQTRTITHATCKNRTINVEVYSCGLFGGECVHRKYCTDHDPAIRVCVGCRRE